MKCEYKNNQDNYLEIHDWRWEKRVILKVSPTWQGDPYAKYHLGFTCGCYFYVEIYIENVDVGKKKAIFEPSYHCK